MEDIAESIDDEDKYDNERMVENVNTVMYLRFICISSFTVVMHIIIKAQVFILKEIQSLGVTCNAWSTLKGFNKLM